MFQESEGKRDIEKRVELKFPGEGEGRKVLVDPSPSEVLASMDARDAYNARVPVDRDSEQNGPTYAFQVADFYFAYGHFKEARERLRPIDAQICGKKKWGYKVCPAVAPGSCSPPALDRLPDFRAAGESAFLMEYTRWTRP